MKIKAPGVCGHAAARPGGGRVQVPPPARDETTKIKILVCYHKPWPFPQEDVFMPIHGGRAVSSLDLNLQGDNTGDNISVKNPSFSEMTVCYWAWKNIKKIYPNLTHIGLAHYRRFLVMDQSDDRSLVICRHMPEMRNYEELFLKELEKVDIILQDNVYFGCSVKEQYARFHYVSDVLCVREIIHEFCPDYVRAFDEIFDHDSGIALQCIFIAGYEWFDAYCRWLFPLLFEMEKRMDVSTYTSYQKRVPAFLAERLLNVYIKYNKLKCAHRPIYFIES